MMGKLGRIKFAPLRWFVGFISLTTGIAVSLSLALALFWVIGYGLYEGLGFSWFMSYVSGENNELIFLGVIMIGAMVILYLLCSGGKEVGDWLLNGINNKKAKKAKED